MNDTAAGRARFRSFGEKIRRSSPLYSAIALAAADDEDMLGLVSEVPDDDGVATLLLAAVHYLARRSDSKLAAFYPTLGGTLEPGYRAWQAFRDFALDHRHQIGVLLRTKSVQTNEVRRAAVIRPALARIARRVRGPVSLVEVGCSAGLLLSLDRYSYRYRVAGGEEIRVGRPESGLRLDCDVYGSFPLDVAEGLSFVSRVGLDRNPLDCRDPEQLAWLEACVWADQPARLKRLREAIREHRPQDVVMLAGDAIGHLSTAISATADDSTVVVLTSWLFTYLVPDGQLAFRAALRNAAHGRELWWAGNETYESCLGHGYPQAGHLSYRASGRCVVAVAPVHEPGAGAEILGTADVHGASLHGFSGPSIRVSW
ncbi:DUF2332 domain-containing protein [Amycolatopsis sp. Hca4]|uniref:DUF2332 domain-containing protein n=1 Tax=Amycolatopsis sp. Hca4 TaxID=2742131 RepID=UPI0015928287|nr:DUF2332 domain-containing protein [Amycolatopsis sp. Hca4]QKV80636.1 DUF2332 domain-containing protein [Amycolatopsis sp. Hca4]